MAGNNRTDKQSNYVISYIQLCCSGRVSCAAGGWLSLARLDGKQLFNSIHISNRDTSLNIILPEKKNTFLHTASLIWNTIHKSIVKSDSGLETSVSIVKLRSTSIILNCQAVGLKDHWTDKNFQITSAHDTSSPPPSSSTSSNMDIEKVINIVS